MSEEAEKLASRWARFVREEATPEQALDLVQRMQRQEGIPLSRHVRPDSADAEYLEGAIKGVRRAHSTPLPETFPRGTPEYLNALRDVRLGNLRRLETGTNVEDAANALRYGPLAASRGVSANTTGHEAANQRALDWLYQGGRTREDHLRLNAGLFADIEGAPRTWGYARGRATEEAPAAVLSFDVPRSLYPHEGLQQGETQLPRDVFNRWARNPQVWTDEEAYAADILGRTKKGAAMNRKDRDIELWEQWKRTKSPYDLDMLMKQMDPVIQSEVNKWSGAIARPVVESQARVLALEAFETYDPKHGAALNTHLTNRLRKLSRKVYTHQDAVRLPEHRKLRALSLAKGQQEFMSQMGREPTHQEMADHMGWSPTMVAKVNRELSPELVGSADTGAGMFENRSVWGRDSDDGMVDMLYYDLDPIDQVIFEHSTGYGGKPVLSNPQLRAKTNLTQSQLSFRKRKIVNRVQDLQRGV